MTEQLSWKQEEDKEEIDMKFENKVAIITGSTRGIGRATAAGRGGLAYTSAKHGLLGLTRQMSLDHGRTGVRINTVLPGPIATDMIARVLAIPPASGNNEDWNESGKTSWRTHRSSAGYCIPCIGRSKFHPWSSIVCRWWIYDILKFRK